MNGYNGNQDERRYGRGVLLGDYGTDEAGMAGAPGACGVSQGAVPGQAATGGAPLFFCECALSAQGKVTEKVETGPLGRDHFTYAYDAVGHLTEVRKNELLVEYYQFDEDGRRIQDYRTWAGQKRTLTYNFDGTLIQAGKDRLEWTDKGQLSVMELDGQRMSFTYGHDSRLDRVTLANGSDVRYFYGNELLPVKITYNGATLAEYQWKDALRLERCRVNGLHYAFVYGQGRAPLQVTVSGTAEAVQKAIGLHEKYKAIGVLRPLPHRTCGSCAARAQREPRFPQARASAPQDAGPSGIRNRQRWTRSACWPCRTAGRSNVSNTTVSATWPLIPSPIGNSPSALPAA